MAKKKKTARQKSAAAALVCRPQVAAASAAALIAAAVLWMWQARGLPAEDGLIYLRYAFNLANGYGLVYNPGEYYESNTNFLWTLLLLPPFWFGWDAIVYLQLAGVAMAAAVLWLVYDIVRRAGGEAPGVLAVLLLGTHATLIFIAPSGFVPHLASLFALAAMAFYWRYVGCPCRLYAAGIGVSLSLLLLTRLDAVLLFAVLWMMLCLSAILARSAPEKSATPPHQKRANRLMTGLTTRLTAL